MTERVGVILHELRSIAQQGIHFAALDGHVHDERRYEALMRVAAELASLDGTDPDETELAFARQPVSATPYVGCEAAVVDDAGRLLLIRREDDGLWALPGGASDVGETAAETATREIAEEACVRVVPKKLVGIYDSRLCGTRTNVHLYQIVFLCDLDGEEQPKSGPETTDVGWFAEDELPDLSPGHPVRIADVFATFRGERTDPFFDGERR